jgi:porphobilinogen synthase
MYPNIRLRRSRSSSWIRDLVSESDISVNDLILPLFVIEGHAIRESIDGMPGVYRLSIDCLYDEVFLAEQLGIKAIALFPCVDKSKKTYNGEESYNAGNLVCKSIKHLKDRGIKIGIICDVALDPYTTHGHDGVILNGIVDNDRTIEALQKQSLTLASAGADIVAPSDMMDGRIGEIRKSLDDNGYTSVAIISYAAKFASSFYAPFRGVIRSQGLLEISDKKTYQMDVRNINEAMREIELDIAEGSDIIMIKPGMTCLDIIYAASSRFDIPIFAYQVSGEYKMLSLGSANDDTIFCDMLLESMRCFKRAGARAIFTYGALYVAQYLHI